MTNKNLLCLSWCDADNVLNYGQILQALAMMDILRECTAGNITYVSYFPRGLKDRIYYILNHISFNNGHLNGYLKTKKTINTVIHNKCVNFYEIQRQDIPQDILENVDIFICGSDQIWHPQNYNKNYFLGFGTEKVKRIAYAASLPKTHVEPQFKEQYESMKLYLNRFDFIAIREQSSVHFLSDLCNKDVVSVMDPTFLAPITFWEKMIEEIKIKESFLFVYIPNGMDKQMAEMISCIRNDLDIERVLVMITRGENHIENATLLNFVSVGEFLYLIKNAKCVITSSFHAVVFSSIFHTNFYAYDVVNIPRGEDIRLKDILETLGLENRKIDLNKCIEYRDINFSMVDLNIKKKTDISMKILKENIQ